MTNIVTRVRRRLLRVAGIGDADARLDWGEDLSITHLTPVKRPCHGNAVNKAGRLVLRGRLGGTVVKLYEAASPKHAEFIRHVTESAEVGSNLPAIVATSERFVIAHWINGNAMEHGSLRGRIAVEALTSMATLQARLHLTPADTLPPTGFDYWLDFVRPRFLRACELLRTGGLFREVSAVVDAYWRTAPPVLMHPDLRPANLVCGSEGCWFVVDNELLTTGGLPLLDVQNTLETLAPQLRQLYLARYMAAVGRHSVSHEEEHAVGALWLAKEVGRCFVVATLPRARDLVAAYRAGRPLLLLGSAGIDRARTAVNVSPARVGLSTPPGQSL